MFLKNFFKYYLPLLVWLGVIFYFSSLSDLRYRTGDISSEVILRKGAHWLEYVFLAFLFWRVFFELHQLKEGRAFWLAFSLLALYALSDEWHQSFVVGRSGKLIDALYDCLSGLVFLQGMLFWRKRTWKRAVVFLIIVGGLVLLENKIIIQAEQYSALIEKKEVLPEQPESKKVDFKEMQQPVEMAEPLSTEKPSFPSIEKETIQVVPLPEESLVSVPFTSQAPGGVWDEYHEEACEEASLLMVAHYLSGKALDKTIAEKELQALIAFQIKNYGDYKDSDVSQTIRLGKDFYGLDNLKAVYDFSLADLKKYLAQGKPIIVPAAGRLLKNPFFTSPGPLYHNLVLIGFEKDVIIANDPGTRRGESYRYAENVLFSAIHDFPGNKEEIETDRKAMIVIEEK